jgi:hypothetical protein
MMVQASLQQACCGIFLGVDMERAPAQTRTDSGDRVRARSMHGVN